MKRSISWQIYDGSSLLSSGLDGRELDSLHKLHLEAFTDKKDKTFSRFLQQTAEETVLVGSDRGHINAISVYNYQPFTSESYMFVSAMAVDAHHHRQGIGSIALRRIIDEAIVLGCDNVRLHARKSVLGFYETHGFERNNHLETNLDYVPMHLNLAGVALSSETTLRTLAKSV